MFRLHRNKPSERIDAVGEKIDFTFSKIQVLRVPKGWDKLYLSLISSETGKTVKKTGRGSVKDGTCQWMETLTESIWISNLDSPKESENHSFKFVVAMGSSKSNILGETTIDLAAFLSLEISTLVSFPLKECDYGTVLLVEIRCLTPKTNPRDEKWKEMQANKDVYDVENTFQVSDSTTTKNTISYYSNKETSFSSSISPYNNLVGRKTSSSQSNKLSSPNCGIRGQDSVESHENELSCSYSTVDPPELGGEGQRELRKIPHATAQMLQQNPGLSTKFKEPDDGAEVEVLKAEAKMWEQNARKLAIDIENLRNELADQFLNMTNLNMELVTSHSECCKLSQEIDHLKLLLEESTEKHIVSKKFEVLGSTRDDMQEQMEDEMRYLKELNENLSSQLKKTQEANLELVRVLQEMEEIMEKQKLEIDSFLSLKSVYTNSKNSCISDECREIDVDDQVSIDKMKLNTDISEISLIHNDGRILQENEGKLNLESQNLEELQKNFWREILYLRSTLQEKMVEKGIEQEVENLILKEFEVECSFTLAAKEQRILDLEAALSRTLSAQNQKESRHLEASKEIKHLKEKVRELQTDCNELTAENLHILFELKEIRKKSSKEADTCLNCSSREGSVDDFRCSSLSVEEIEKKETIQERLSELQDESIDWKNQSQSFKFHACELDVEATESCLEERFASLEKNHLSELQKENDFLSQRISGLEAQLRYLTDTNESSRLELEHSESQVGILQNEIKYLEETNELQNLGMQNKLLEMERLWLEAQEECNSLKKMNMSLQVSTENLMEECDSLQKFNVELRQQISRFQDKFFVSEAEVRKFQDFVRSENIGTSQVEERFQDSELVEAKHKTIVNELESQIKYSETEEENTFLHMQLVKAPELQNEVLALRASLKEMKSENQILEAALKSVSGDFEELKHENGLMARKISSMQNVMLEAEDCRHEKIVLEEKILRLEGDLVAKDALYAMDAGMKNVINRAKQENTRLSLEVQNLEDVREELQKKVHCLEEELTQTKVTKECQRESISKENKDDFMSRDQESQHPENETCDLKRRSQLCGSEAAVSKKPESRETIAAANNEHKITLLEAELQDIRDRYLQISLKYAEVEAQKEQLLMKVKALNTSNSFAK